MKRRGVPCTARGGTRPVGPELAGDQEADGTDQAEHPRETSAFRSDVCVASLAREEHRLDGGNTGEERKRDNERIIRTDPGVPFCNSASME